MKVLIGVFTFVAFAGVHQTAATRPNFSGVWVEEARPVPPPTNPPYCPGKCTIKHSTEQLVFDWVLKDGDREFPFKKVIDLLKPQVTVSGSGDGEEPIEHTIGAEWQGNTLIVTRTIKGVSQTTGTGLTHALRLTLRDNKLVLSGTATTPPVGPSVPFEVVYRKEKFVN